MEPDWPTCTAEDSCTGIQLWHEGPCLAHAKPETKDLAMAMLRAGANLDVARGVPIDNELLGRILEAAPREDGRPVLRNVHFGEAQFSGEVDFSWATFSGEADSRWAADFRWATFSGKVDFSGATFPVAGATFPVAGLVDLSHVSFGECQRLAIAAQQLSLDDSRFPAGSHLQVWWADVSAADADFSKPVLLSAKQPSDDLERAFLNFVTLVCGRAPNSPRLVSLQRADVAELTISGVDLSECRFAGAHHLDKLHIEGASAFGRAPGRSSRRVLAEERDWRRDVAHKRRWQNPPEPPDRPDPTDWLGEPDQLEPAEVAALYRALRKGREDAKDEPGAADFYYGEMEMRRLSRDTPPAERLILWAYWLVSGYGLQSLRAFTLLIVLLAVSTSVIANGGFPPPPQPSVVRGTVPGGTVDLRVEASPTTSTTTPARRSAAHQTPRYCEAFWVSLSAAVVHGPETKLTPKGERVTTVVRYLGPILVGLTLLAVRGRVKR